jgi:fatty acid desaturase
MNNLPLALRFAIPGAAAGLVFAAVITIAVGGGSHTIWWWPAGAVIFAFAGCWLGLMFEEEVEDGRDDHEAARLRHEAGRSEH